jgi:hypothetical protein
MVGWVSYLGWCNRVVAGDVMGRADWNWNVGSASVARMIEHGAVSSGRLLCCYERQL